MHYDNMEVCRRFESVADRLENAAKTKRIKVIDSVKAQKAMDCVQEIANTLSSCRTSHSFCERVETILRKYGQGND